MCRINKLKSFQQNLEKFKVYRAINILQRILNLSLWLKSLNFPLRKNLVNNNYSMVAKNLQIVIGKFLNTPTCLKCAIKNKSFWKNAYCWIKLHKFSKAINTEGLGLFKIWTEVESLFFTYNYNKNWCVQIIIREKIQELLGSNLNICSSHDQRQTN